MVKIGVLLSGSGVYDGTEIHEAVLTLLAIDKAGAQAVCMAPNVHQTEVINHLTGGVSGEVRNVLVESARIARGNIRDLRDVHATDIDALILPGGWGAVKNLSNFCWKGDRCWVDGEVYRLLREMRSARKPIGAMCIAPAIIAKTFSEEHPKLTIGTDEGVAATIEQIGARHLATHVEDIVVDEDMQIITTPAYMLARSIREVAGGIERLVESVVRRAKKSASRSVDSAVACAPCGTTRPAADSAIAKPVIRTRAPAKSAKPTRRKKTSR